MNESLKRVTVFLASPSDTEREREICRELIDRLNRTVAAHQGLLLYLQEARDALPGAGRPQQVILDELDPSRWSVFLGFLWSRFGTPSGGRDPATGAAYLSGTEEEFRTAYGSWQKTGKPRILMYRSGRKLDPDRLIPEQFARVRSFFDELSAAGSSPAWFKEYRSYEKLEDLLAQDLTTLVLRLGEEEAQLERVRERGGVEMVHVPAGRFRMGTDRRELAAAWSTLADELTEEEPQHEVELPGFSISRHPVTHAQYRRFVEETSHPVPFRDDALSAPYNWDPQRRVPPAGREEHPVVLVSWHDAQAYCRWLGGRLPTEAEWEKAARGSDGRLWPWGSRWEPGRCNSFELGAGETTPVRRFIGQGESPHGVLDLAGNAWEWCHSLFASYPYAAGDGREAPSAAGPRVIRGGDFQMDALRVRSTHRRRVDPHDRGFSISFRVVLPERPDAG